MKYYRKPNNKAIYKQYDSRWGKLYYPNSKYTVASSGCGLCAVTHCVIERAIYFDCTPKDFYAFMKKYAVSGHGTEWKGIDEGLKKYGLKNVKRIDTMSALWKELEKGNRVGVLLFNNNTSPNGTRWTSGGHYVSFCGYRKSDDGKKHYLYCKDSGGRGHDGWYEYSTSMRNCIRLVWTAEVPAEVIKLPERGYFQIGDTGTSVKYIQAFLKGHGFYNGKVGGNYKKLTEQAVRDFQTKYHDKYGLDIDGLWGKQCNKAYEILK